MNETMANPSAARFPGLQSLAARQRMLSEWGEPLFVAGWQRVLMIHFEVDAKALQRDVPFQLDLHEGRAFVSLVAFTMCGMRPRFGGKLSAWLFRPIATHDFLNVRTYVRHAREPGIHFLAEWLTSRLAVRLGPATFGLPYHYGQIAYDHEGQAGVFLGEVVDVSDGNKLLYRASTPKPANFDPCEPDSLQEWLMERYTAFNFAGRRKRFFRVWHPPWPQCAVSADLKEMSLLTRTWSWFQSAQLIGANYSPGLQKVWMGRPHLC